MPRYLVTITEKFTYTYTSEEGEFASEAEAQEWADGLGGEYLDWPNDRDDDTLVEEIT